MSAKLKYVRWNQLFLTDDETIMPGDFKNEAGQSILDLMSKNGMTPAEFYRQRLDLDAFLAEQGCKLDDFKRSDMTITAALELINKRGNLFEGADIFWTVERLLCFRGNTYNEFFMPTGRVLLDRIERLAGDKGNYRIFATGFTFTLIAASVLAYSLAPDDGKKSSFISKLFSSNAEQKADPNVIAPPAIKLINQEVGSHLPVLTDEISPLLGGSSAVDSIAAGTGIDLSTVGKNVAGNYYDDVRAVAEKLVSSMGKAEVDQSVLDALSERLSAGLRVSSETCSQVASNGSFYSLAGFKYSPAVYFAALTRDKAVETINSIAEKWRRGELAGKTPEGAKLVYSYQELLNHVEKGGCEVSPVTIFRPTLQGFGDAGNFYIVSVISRGQLTTGNANVSQTLFVLADTAMSGKLFGSSYKQSEKSNAMKSPFSLSKIGSLREKENNLAVRGIACANCEAEISAAYESIVPKPLSAEAACKKLDNNEQLTIEDQAAYFQLFSKAGFKDEKALKNLNVFWTNQGEEEKSFADLGYQVVSLEEFLQHRKKGECKPLGTVVYKLNSDTTPYLLSSLRYSAGQLKPVLVMAYDITKYAPSAKKTRGMMQINCEKCATDAEISNANLDKIKLTLLDLDSKLKSAGFKLVEVDSSKLMSALVSHIAEAGFKIGGDNLDESIRHIDREINKIAKAGGSFDAEFSTEKAIEAQKDAISEILRTTIVASRNGSSVNTREIFNSIADKLREKNKSLSFVNNRELFEIVAESFAGDGKTTVDFEKAVQSFRDNLAKNEFLK